MRKLLAALVLLLAAPAALPCDRLVFRNGDVTTNSGCDMDVREIKAVRATYGRRFVWFERAGRTYVSRDEGLLKRLAALYQPQTDLGGEQAALGMKQAALGQVQAQLGSEQAAIGLRQAQDPNNGALAAKQNELARRQNELARQQNVLAEKQNRMAARQNELAREAERKLPAILDEAIAKGLATRL
ncbi:MAG TPA: hypothetical protein VJ276_25910 [Thermoanaerobaculia bacterium]|nr:hypothetical protein [Thermoanaerobaculia bacterium]